MAYVWPRLHGQPQTQTTQGAATASSDSVPKGSGQKQGSTSGGRRSRQLASGEIPVMAVQAQAGDISLSLDALGTVTPLATVTVRPQLSGYLTQVAFAEGQMVKQGDFLAQIDPRPYQIALEQAQGQLARDQALLKNAQIDLARYQKLNAQDSIARQQLDTQQSLVLQYQGTIISDQAQVDTAKLDLDYCHITAPVTGRVGLRQVDQGNYVQTGDTNGLVVITQLQPITVIFTIPEDNIPLVQQGLQAGQRLQVTAFDRTGTTELATGELATIDNQIDTTTGTVKLRAHFDNTDNALFPNQFVNVTLHVRTEQALAIVPMAAIQHGSAGAFVYRVKDDKTVTVQPVKIGIVNGDKVEIVSGLKTGDQVVVDGVDQLREGSKVIVSDASKNANASTESRPAMPKNNGSVNQQ
ncbi:MAG TPA: MdtA/MuxA family multidrug efflux RND transporter periplasmic adaptor subunit [Dongiaceae bacterium]|nr:MdtA/MuxA family multidrug efflux RND transporter periplasmic adaptor subunit [Dongiaceae bacterium]